MFFAVPEIVPFMVTVTVSPAGMLVITVLNLLSFARLDVTSVSPTLISETVISAGISSETVTFSAVALPSFLTVIV